MYAQETPDSYEEMWWPDDLRLGWSEEETPDEGAKGREDVPLRDIDADAKAPIRFGITRGI